MRRTDAVVFTLALAAATLGVGDLAAAASHYTKALASGPEPFERARLLDRLAISVVESAPDRAASFAAEARRIRHHYGFAILPIDESIVADLSARLAAARPGQAGG